jgi:Holliday junction resolvase RusA-like endonuclease
MILNIAPFAKPRMTQRDRWAKRQIVRDYFAFRDTVKQEIERLLALQNNDDKNKSWEELDIGFFIPMPKSWSKKKRSEMAGTPHKQRPDLDNYIKGLLDALLEEDCKVWRVSARKIWVDTEGCITINRV